jgi:hypothetical protein
MHIVAFVKSARHEQSRPLFLRRAFPVVTNTGDNE